MKLSIKILYLYLFSFVGLIITVVGSINMMNVGLKTFVFKDVDKYTPFSKEEIADLCLKMLINMKFTSTRSLC